MLHLRTIYRKELLDTLRDRRTLVFMILLPTVMMPLLILGITRVAISIQKEQALRPVVIAATPADRAAWEQLVHAWFVNTEMARGIRTARSPWLRPIIRPERLEELDRLPANLLDDPAVFAEWTRTLASQARSGIETDATPAADATAAVQNEAALDFYRVAIKALGLVEFVDPDELPTPSPQQRADPIPEALASLPGIERLSWALDTGRIHGSLTVTGTLDDVLARPEAFVEVTLVHDSTAGLSGEAANRIREATGTISRATTGVRLTQRGLPTDFVRPVRWRADGNLAPMGRQVLQHVGGLLPYLVLVFTFMGAFYAAVDLGAGEKERQTLETLLLTPCSRTHIALGKFFAILTTSLAAALLGVLSLMLSVRFLVPAGVIEMLELRIAPGAWAATGLLMLPAAALFAGIFLAVSIVARSTKEAQTYLVPFQFVLLLPAAAPLIPGIELTTRTALIPLVNVSLLAREILKGGLDWGYYALTLTTCGALAAAGIAACVYLFGREEVLFRA